MLCSCYKNRVSQERIIRLRRIEVSIKTVCAPFLVTLVTLSWGSRCYHEKKKKYMDKRFSKLPPGEGLRGSLGVEELSLAQRYPRGKSWVQQTLVPSADLGRVHVNNKLWLQGFSATPQASLPAGNFALRSRSPGQRMVEAKAETVVAPFLICRQEGPIRAQATSSFHLSSTEKWEWQQHLSQGNFMRLKWINTEKALWTKCGTR